MSFYVYIHRKNSNGEIFYVGKGKRSRAYAKTHRSLAWKNIVSKHGYYVEIVENDIQEWYAFELEKNLIALYGKRCDGTGSLVNYTDGGEGSSGRKISNDTLLKLKLSAKNRKYTKEMLSKMSRLGTKHSEETKLKIKMTSTGRKHSDISKLKISIGNSDRKQYSLKHLDGSVFIGTRDDFYSKYKVNIKPLFKSKPSKIAKGWFLYE